MHIALYRKYRPATFDDVVGQEHIVTHAAPMRSSPGRRPCLSVHRQPRHRKTTCAKILAKALNCRHPVDGDPCCECDICRGIDEGAVLDVMEIDAASNNGVDNIRDLRD